MAKNVQRYNIKSDRLTSFGLKSHAKLRWALKSHAKLRHKLELKAIDCLNLIRIVPEERVYAFNYDVSEHFQKDQSLSMLLLCQKDKGQGHYGT